MNQFAQHICYHFPLESNRNLLNFTVNPNYRQLYHVGWFGNELLFTKNSQFCLLQSRARQLQFMANALKANFQLHIPKEQVGGSLNSKHEWNGMMRLFADRAIDFAFNDYAYQQVREQIVKYSVPLKVNCNFAILSRKTLHQPSFDIFSVFEWPVWTCMLVLCALCLGVLYFVFQLKDCVRLAFDFLGIFLGVGSVVDTTYTYMPRPILSIWLIGTLIFTFVLRNEILAHFTARTIDKVDSIDDIRARNLKVLVQAGTPQVAMLKEAKLQDRQIVQIAWEDQWSVSTTEKVLSGSYVLVLKEDNLAAMASVNHEYPLRLSDERKDLQFEYYLYRRDIDRELERKLNKFIKILQISGIYNYLKMNSYRDYEIFTKRKKVLNLEKLNGRDQSSGNEKAEEDLDAVHDLSLGNIDDSFYCLAYGLIAAFVACIVEMLMDRVYFYGPK